MVTEVWNTVAAGEETTLEQRARCRMAAANAADSARTAMDLVYRQGGSTSYKRESRLAECWRDLHVVGQAVTGDVARFVRHRWLPPAYDGAIRHQCHGGCNVSLYPSTGLVRRQRQKPGTPLQIEKQPRWQSGEERR